MSPFSSFRFYALLTLVACACLGASPLLAQAPPAPAAPPAKPATKPAKPKPPAASKAPPVAAAAAIDGFSVPIDPANIAPTPAIRTIPAKVEGSPTNMTQHPNIFCDQTDIDHYKEMLKTSKELQMQFEVMKQRMDTRIAAPIDVPTPQKGADGNYPFIGQGLPDFPGKGVGAPPYTDPQAKFRKWFTSDADDVSDLGFVYAITGDKKYAEYAKKLLLAWSCSSQWGPMENVRLRSGQGVWGQIFEEGLIMDHYVRGYDFIYDLPGWTEDERKQIHDEFFFPMAQVWLYPGAPDYDKDNAGGAFASQVNNRGLITLTGIYAMGTITNDQTLIDAALYGIHAVQLDTGLPMKKPDNAELTKFPPRKDWVPATKESPGHGMLNTYFGDGLIPGGMYAEGTPSYAFYALGSMIDAAEIGWRHGVDLYSNNNCAFKYMFDFPILLSYPDFTTPGLNDAHRETIVGGGSVPGFYEYAYRRYKDPRYLMMINPPEEKEYLKAIADPDTAKKYLDAMLNPPPPPPKPEPGAPAATPAPKELKSVRHLTFTQVGSIPPNFMYDLDPNAGAEIPPSPSVNYALVGFGILRSPSTSGGQTQGVILSSGPSASHGHPDKLAIDVYAMNDLLMPSPGVNFPYANNDRIPRWYQTSLSHNTLTVDEKPQFPASPGRRADDVRADQTIFGTCSTGGVQRAWTCSVFDGVTMDRAVFLRPNYMADIFGAFSASPHKYDFAWHIRGAMTSELTFAPFSFDKSINGYNFFTEGRAAEATDKSFTVTATNESKVAKLYVASGPATQAIIGEGGIYNDHTYVDPVTKITNTRPTCPTLIERREGQTATIYGNALDFSGKGDYVKGVTQDGGFDKGYALLNVTTADGSDLCFAAYKPGNYTASGLTTDALQAYVSMTGTAPNTLYLAGGKTLTAGGASITRSEPGLAYVEKTLDGNYIVGNPSPTPATVTVTLPALAGLEGVTLDDKGEKGAAAQVTKNGAAISLQLAAGGKVEFAKK